MKFNFYQFTLDDKRQTLQHNDVGIDITKINYEVLLYFIHHHSEVVTKDQLIEAVWQGKMVTDNSIDQSISKLRKSMSQFDERVIIKTVYGKGFELGPDVVCVDDEHLPVEQSESKKQRHWLTLAAMGVVVMLLLWQFVSPLINQPKANNQPPVMWLANENNSDWLNQSSRQLLNQMFVNSGQNHLLDSDNKPKQLNNQQYIENYWRIYPDLEVIESDLQKQDDIYTLSLEVATRAGAVTESFSGTNLLKILTDSNQWLIANTGLSEQQANSQELLPQDSHVLELYLRSLHAYYTGELDQALNYSRLVIDQEPSFDLAWLHLAQVQYAQGNNEPSLATLNELKNSVHYNQIEIAAQSLRGDILDTSGDYQQAIETYQQLMDKYPEEAQRKLLPVKFNLSYSLTSVQRYEDALMVLDGIINALDDQYDMDLLAHAWHKKGSVLLQIGQTEAAKNAANLAYRYFNDLADMMSSAKVSILLARIANHEADYQLAADYLQQAIGVYRQAEFPLGIGATLNELIYTLVVNGEFSDAWKHIIEMRQIAQDIDYFAMLMAAQQFEIEIARYRQQWEQAEAALAEYFRLATDNNFTRGLTKHQLFELDFALDQQQLERALPLIEQIQLHINTSGEVRLQPRLNVQKFKVYLLQGEFENALELLSQSKAMALQTKDMESIHEINNELLKYHLANNHLSESQQLIQKIDRLEVQPLDYPYLLLKSKVQFKSGYVSAALRLAQQSKQAANEFWRIEDEQYLKQLQAQ